MLLLIFFYYIGTAGLRSMKHGIAEYNRENAKTENGIAAFLYAMMEMAVEEANRDQSFNKCRR